MSKIDRNRGCIYRKSAEGYRVVMYVDTPGVYFDENGNRISDEIAEAAGFNIINDRKDRARQKLKINYERHIGAKFAEMEQRVDDLLENNPNLIDELSIVELTPSNFAIVDPDGTPISETRLTYEEAAVLFVGLVGEEYVSDAEDAPDMTNPFMDMDSKEIRRFLKEAEVEVPVGMRMPKLAIFAFENVALVDEDGGEGSDTGDADDSSDLL